MIKRRGVLVFWVAWVLVFGSAWGDANPSLVLKIFQIKHRKASSMKDIVKIYQSKDGVCIADERTNKLIVKDYPENISKIEKLIYQMDVPAPQVRIWVTFLGKRSISKGGVFGSIEKKGKNWVVGIYPVTSKNSYSSHSNLNIVTMSGEPAFIKIGERVPYVSWFYSYCLNRGYIAKGVRFQEVSTGFYVVPQVYGKNVILEISPGISYFDGTYHEKVIFKELSTTVELVDGQSAVLGIGSGGKRENMLLLSHILGIGNISSSEYFSMKVRVKILKF